MAPWMAPSMSVLQGNARALFGQGTEDRVSRFGQAIPFHVGVFTLRSREYKEKQKQPGVACSVAGNVEF